MTDMPKSPRIVVTGLGSCSAAGNTAGLWDAALRKSHCLCPWHESGAEDPVDVVGRVTALPDELFAPRVQPSASRHALLGAAALRECLDDARLAPGGRDDTGLLFCSASQGLDRGEDVMRRLRAQSFSTIDPSVVQCVYDAGACHLLAATFGFSGYVHAVQAASCAGMVAVQTAVNAVRSGRCARVCCVSGEANLFPASFLFYAMRARIDGATCSFFGRVHDRIPREPEQHVRPFGPPSVSDRGAIAEGGAAVLLESLDSALERQAPIYAELDQCHIHFHCDNHHGADYELVGLSAVLARMGGAPVDSLYLPVTGAAILDLGPCTAAGQLFPGTHAFTVEPVIGHTGAATSLLNAALAALSIRNQTLLPTRNLELSGPNPGHPLTPSSEPIRDRPVGRIIVVSSGWGGYNGACALKRYEP